MTSSKDECINDVLIIGGGIAGLVNAIHLSMAGLKVLVIEKNEFPKHKVCGEYISNEVLPYLDYLGIHPFDHGASKIGRFEMSTVKGKQVNAQLPLGGFGISRFTFDLLLYEKALEFGCAFVQDTVEDCVFAKEIFKTTTKNNSQFTSRFVIGAYGKRANLDVKKDRQFIHKRAPYLGVKSHYKGDFPSDLIALHNFKGGYCGVSKIENDQFNVCYLADFNAFKRYKNLGLFEKEVLHQNPHLKKILLESEPVFNEPLAISQISFESKEIVSDHILMSGDSAGMIHPLCGNGMSMAIHSALILSEILIIYFKEGNNSRTLLEGKYQKEWRQTFQKRLKYGKMFNAFFAQDTIFEWALGGLMYVPKVIPHFIKRTHGQLIMPYQNKSF